MVASTGDVKGRRESVTALRTAGVVSRGALRGAMTKQMKAMSARAKLPAAIFRGDDGFGEDSRDRKRSCAASSLGCRQDRSWGGRGAGESMKSLPSSAMKGESSETRRRRGIGSVPFCLWLVVKVQRHASA